MANKGRLRDYLLREDVPLLMKMGELVQNGPTGDFLELWKVVMVCIWKRLQNGSGLSEQEIAARKKLFNLAKIARQRRGQSR